MTFSSIVCERSLKLPLVAGVLVLLLSITAHAVHAAPYSVEPAVPIVSVPFRVTDVGGTPPPNTFVFISQSSTCSGAAEPGTTLMFNPNAITFHVTSTTAKTLYMCHDATKTLLHTINLEKARLFPQWATVNTARDIDVIPVVPSGAVVNFHNFGSCASSVAFTLPVNPSTNQIQWPPTPSTQKFPCLVFTDSVTLQVQNLQMGRFDTFANLAFQPNVTIMHKTDTFYVSGVSGGPVRWFQFSDCTVPVSKEFPLNGVTNDFTAKVETAKGVYHFCWDSSVGFGNYISIGTIEVKRFKSLPTQVFRSFNVYFRLIGDSPWTTNFIVADVNCQNNFLGYSLSVSPSTGVTSTPVNFPAIGTHYICVQEATGGSGTPPYILADTVDVINMYQITLNPTTAVRGLITSVAANTGNSPASSIYFAAPSSACDPATQYANFTVVGWSGQLIMPTQGAGSTVSSYTMCAYTQDRTYAAPLPGSYGVRDYVLQLNVPLTVIERSIILDIDTPLPASIYLYAGATCGPKVGSQANYTLTTRAANIIYPKAGQTSICYQSTASTVSMLDSVMVIPLASFTPSATFRGTTTSMTIYDVAETNSVLMIISATAYSSCPTVFPGTGTAFIHNSSFASTGTQIISVNFNAVDTYRVCMAYQNIVSGKFFVQIGIMTVVQASAEPKYFVNGGISWVRAVIPPAFGPVVVQSLYISNSASCADTAPTVYPTTVNGTAQIPVTVPANVPAYVCFRTANMTVPGQYGVAQGVTVFPEMTFTHPESYAKVVSIPFNIILPNTWTYIPAQFRVFNDPNLCANLVASGNIHSVTRQTTSSIALPQTSLAYSVCVSGPTVTDPYLRAGPLVISKFAAVSRTFIHGIAPIVVTSPSLSIFKFFLTGSSDCLGTTRYYLDNETALPSITPPSNVYYLCAYQDPVFSSWLSPSSNTVSVVGAFSAVIPSGVKGEVPFTVTFSTDVPLGGGMQYAYVKAGLNQKCVAATDNRLLGTKGGTSTTQVQLVVPHRTNVTVCALSADNSTAAAVGSIIPLPYTSPSEIVKTNSGNVEILLGDGSVPAGATVYLTRDIGCTFPDLGTFTVQTGGHIVVPLPSTTSVNYQQYVCLQLSAGAPIKLMDWLFVWDSFGATTITVVDGGFPRWGTPPGTYWPAQPIRIGLPPNLHSPFLAHNKDCTGSGVVSNAMLESDGVFPAEGENTTYFICAVTSRATLVASPTPINFVNFQFVPQKAVTDLDQAAYFFPPLPRFATTASATGGIFFSRSATCSPIVSGPFYTNVSKPSVPGGDGMVYTCILPAPGVAAIRVASHMYYRRADMTVLSPHNIVGLPFCASVAITQVPKQWNQLEGVPPVTGPFTARRWFLATARSNCSAAVTPKVRLNHETDPWCLETGLLTSGASYDLCGPTPNGEVPYLMDRVFAYVTSNNTKGYVYGAPVAIPTVTVPLLPSTDFGWAAPPATCAGVLSAANGRRVGPDWRTDAFGFSLVDFRASTAFRPPAFDPFVYNAVTGGQMVRLCMKFTQANVGTSLHREAATLATTTNEFYDVGPVFIGKTHQYSVSSSRIISLVKTAIDLQEDLHFSYLAGISTSPTCATLDSSSISFAPVAGTTRQAVVQTTVALGSASGASYFLCARAPVNDSIVPIQPMQTFYTSDFVHQSVESACQTFVVGYADSTSIFATRLDAVITLVRGACCRSTGAVPQPDLLSTGVRTGALHTFYVTATEIQRMNGTQLFSVCYNSAGLAACLAAGQMNVTSQSCVTTLAPSPVTADPGALPLADNAVLGFAGKLTGNAVHDAAILGAVLFFIALLILLLCCLGCYRRGVVPPEEEDKLKKRNLAGMRAGVDDGLQPQNANSFAELFQRNRRIAAVGAHGAHEREMLLLGAAPGDYAQTSGGIDIYAITAGLPIATTLDMCHEPTNDSLAAEAEERREREDILLCEQFLFEKMRRSYVTELRGLSAVAVGSDRTRMIREGNHLQREQRENFCDIEEEHRAEIERQEQEEMYDIAVRDQEGYRTVAGHERDALNSVWQGEEESWSARRQRLLLSGHGRAIEAAEAGHYGSGGVGSDAEVRHTTTNVLVSPVSRARGLVGPAGAASGAFSPASDQAPPPPSIEPLMTSPVRGDSYKQRGAPGEFRPVTHSSTSVNTSAEFRDPLGYLPSGPAPSPPPLAIGGDPLLHFTVPAPNNSMLNRSLPSPGAAAATPFRDPLSTAHVSPSRNPLHHPLTPTHPHSRFAAGGGGGAALTAPIPPHHVVDSQQQGHLDAYYPSHASRPAMMGGSDGGGSNVRWGPGGVSASPFGGGMRQQDPSEYEVYRAPRR